MIVIHYYKVQEKRKLIKTIIFDIGNVLAKFAWKEYLMDCGYERKVIDKVANATVNHSLWKELDRNVDIEAELMEQFVALDLNVAEEIRDFLEHSHLVVKEYDYSLDLIQKLKAKGYQVYLLSNYGGRNFNYAKEQFTFLPYVDGGVISYEVGYVKPENEIFEALITKYQINPSEAVFLDDSEVNINAAARIGFHTIHFQNLETALTRMRKLNIDI